MRWTLCSGVRGGPAAEPPLAEVPRSIAPTAPAAPAAPEPPGNAAEAAPRPAAPDTQDLRVRIVLRPHTHNELCERKDRVCTAFGRTRELETLTLVAPAAATGSVQWLRVDPSAQDGTVPLSNEACAGAADEMSYRLRADDVGFEITCSCMVHGRQVFAEHPAGPVEAAPPRALGLTIEGDAVEGGELRARYRYVGGREGSTEVWWLRVRNGAREPVTAPLAVGHADNPCRYRLTTDDVGCTVKAKCRPVREDACQGEVSTSKASARVVASSDAANAPTGASPPPPPTAVGALVVTDGAEGRAVSL